jgi:hypothetical protein
MRMTGKEVLDEIHIDLKSIDKKKIMEESETITKFRNDIYDMMQKEIIRFTTPLKFEISELNKELAKYKKAFEIFTKDKELTLHKGKCPILGADEYKLSFVKLKYISRAEYELLEELMKDAKD